ncbi:MAG: hypothetical protein EBU08_15940 [Micrococcales bacterium]|nr:hypothetical protein [Micrococcales bacterium]
MFETKETNVTDPLSAFIMSHTQFMALDRYNSNMGWFMMVTLSLIMERPLPLRISNKIDSNFQANVRKSYANLFEYTRTQFPEVTYAKFQSTLGDMVKLVNQSSKEEDSDD